MLNQIPLARQTLFDRFLARGLLLGAIVGALCFLATDFENGFACSALPLILIVAVGWIALLIRNILAHLSRQRKPRWGLWTAVPLIAIACCILSSADVPLTLAVLVSRPSMDALARQALAAPPGTTPAPRQVGLLHAAEIHTFPGGMAFRARMYNPFDWFGFACVPSGVPPKLEGYYFEKPLGGNWFLLFIATEPYPKNAAPSGMTPATATAP